MTITPLVEPPLVERKDVVLPPLTSVRYVTDSGSLPEPEPEAPPPDQAVDEFGNVTTTFRFCPTCWQSGFEAAWSQFAWDHFPMWAGDPELAKRMGKEPIEPDFEAWKNELPEEELDDWWGTMSRRVTIELLSGGTYLDNHSCESGCPCDPATHRGEP